jgi:hypothetical protein
MKADVEIVLDQRGKDWIAHHKDFVVKANTLAEIDEQVWRKLVESGTYPKGSRVTVFMGTDDEMVPAWMRPYQWHYFNRTVSFEV